MKNYLAFSVAFLLLLSVLAGCGGAGRKDALTSAEASAPAEETASGTSPESSPEPVLEPTPEPTPTYDLSFTVGGQPLSENTESLDLTLASSDEIDRLITVLPALPMLQTLELGSAAAESPAISWDQIYALEQGAPQAILHYSFTVQGYSFSLSDEILNLNHIVFSDEGALASKIANCMPNLRILDMDSCGVSNGSMAAIRDFFPDVEVVWRVWIGTGYSVRTNVDRIMISNPDRGGDLDTPESIEGLYYCTKTKYLDMGHNAFLKDISFLANMPDLEVLIIAMSEVKDLSPLANCPKLNYLEMQNTAVGDLRPLSSLKELRDLNICYNFALWDISPLYDLNLDRLYIGCFTPISQDQVAEFRKLHPNCVINTTTEDPTEEGWRAGWVAEGVWETMPRYVQLYDEFQYGNFPFCYSYTENDPRVYNRFSY